MILGEPAVSATNAQISASKKLVPKQVSNIQWLPLNIMQRPRNQVSCGSVAIIITCKEVRDYIDENEDTIVIASFKVEEQFN